MNKITLDFLFEFAKSDSPIQGTFFRRHPRICFDELLAEGYLELTEQPDEVFIREDGKSHLVHQTIFEGRMCCWYVDEDDTVDVDIDLVKFYMLNCAPLATLIHDTFKARKNVSTIIQNSLWLCGNHGRQQRELFLTLNAGTNANVRQWLEENAPPRAVIFQIGNYDRNLISKFKEQKVWYLPELFYWDDNKLLIDQDSVFARIEELLDSQDKSTHKSPPKSTREKRHIEEEFLALFRLLLINARRTRNKKEKPLSLGAFDRIPRNQEDAASIFKISTAMMSRIKTIWETEKVIHPGYEAYISLMDFFFKQEFDSDSVFSFYDKNKTFLRDAGFVDDY